MKMYCGSGGVAPRVLNLGTIWRWVEASSKTAHRDDWLLSYMAHSGPTHCNDSVWVVWEVFWKSWWRKLSQCFLSGWPEMSS